MLGLVNLNPDPNPSHSNQVLSVTPPLVRSSMSRVRRSPRLKLTLTPTLTLTLTLTLALTLALTL